MSDANGHTNGRGRPGVPKPRRLYSDDERAEALALLAGNGGNLKKTAEDSGIPLATIQKWRDGKGVHPSVIVKCEEKKAELSGLFEEVARKYLARASNAAVVEKTSGKDAIIGAATAVDKMRLLRGEPTSIQQDLVELSDEQLEREIAECRAQIASAPARATPAAG